MIIVNYNWKCRNRHNQNQEYVFHSILQTPTITSAALAAISNRPLRP